MKKYAVRLAPPLLSFLRHLHPVMKSKIRRALELLETDPHLGKPLKEQLSGLFSYRVANYRIIYQIKQEKILIEVIEIAERKIVYQKVLALISKFKD